jgi:hypothetical protein
LIRGFFDSRFPDWPIPRVSATLDLPALPRGIAVPPFEVDFIVDTGSGETCLGPLDAIQRAQIPLEALLLPGIWALRREHRGIGGTTEFYVVPCFFAFRDDAGVERRFSAEIDIAQPTTDAYLPSIVGWDVLQHFAIRLDWSQRLVELV